MAKEKIKQISINDIDKINKFNTTNSVELKYYISDEEYITAVCNPIISLQQYGQIVADVVGLIFANGVYNPFMESYAFNYCLVKYFTNFKCDNFEKIFDLINKTTIIQDINNVVGIEMIVNIQNDTECGVEFEKRKIYKTSKWDDVADTLERLLNKVSKSLEGFGKKFENIDPNILQDVLGKTLKLDTKQMEEIVLNKALDKIQEADDTQNKETKVVPIK